MSAVSPPTSGVPAVRQGRDVLPRTSNTTSTARCAVSRAVVYRTLSTLTTPAAPSARWSRT